MKKLFTLVVLMCLLGVNRVWASRDFYFLSDQSEYPTHNVVKPRSSVDEVVTVDCWFRHMNGGGNIVNRSPYSDFKFKVEIIGELQMADGSALTSNGQERNDISGKFEIKFKGRGGAIIVTATSKYNDGLSTFFVITAPYIGNQTWDFYTNRDTEMTYYYVNNGYEYWKGATKFSGHENRPMRVVDMDYDTGNGNQYNNDGHDNIDGTNARYIPATAGLIFTCADEGFGVNDNSNNSNARRYVTFGKKGKLTIPHLKGGTYVRIWWDAMNSGEFGGTFQAEGLLDLEGNAISNEFRITGVTEYGVCRGNTIFKVAGNSDQYTNVSLTLTDDGWNDLYKIEVSDTYDTDMKLRDQMKDYNEVLYNNELGNFVVPESELNQTHNYVEGENGDRPYMSYGGASAYAYINRAKTCRFNVVQEPNNNVVGYVERKWYHSNNEYYNLDITQIKGPGNVKIIQRVYYNGYVLDKKETWIAIGTYTQQNYPYTWDFTKYNVLRPSYHLLAWLGNTNDNNVVRYGHWIEESGNAFNVENHELVDGTIWNVQNNQYEKVHRALFAQGSQLTNEETALNETKGLRVKQYIRKDGEDHIAVGEEYDGEIKMDGTALKFTPNTPSDPNLDHRLKITIPQVENGMYVFVKANQQPNVYKGNTKINSNNTYANANDVGAYPVSGTGDIDLYFDKKDNNNIEIYSIGVTNIIKPVNQYGYATESRDCIIDHTYTGKFTSNDVNAYLMKDYDGTKVTMVETDVIPENTGVVMYKSGTSTGFNAPLFVNACNVAADATDGNLLKPNVTSSTLNMKDGDYTNFILTDISYHIKHMDDVSTMWSGEDKIGFYRVGKAGTLGANKSYLQLPTSDLNTSVGAKGLVLIWDGFGIDEPSGITTALDQVGVDSYTEGEKDIFNLHGQKLDNVSGRKGIFIVNGKKVIVK